LFCLYAAIEEIIITLLIQHELVDVRTAWQALKYKQENDATADNAEINH
jgi:CDP-diacylglycerol--glycerol-3-phosphate 3-phosphatidyltransferase